MVLCEIESLGKVDVLYSFIFKRVPKGKTLPVFFKSGYTLSSSRATLWDVRHLTEEKFPHPPTSRIRTQGKAEPFQERGREKGTERLNHDFAKIILGFLET